MIEKWEALLSHASLIFPWGLIHWQMLDISLINLTGKSKISKKNLCFWSKDDREYLFFRKRKLKCCFIFQKRWGICYKISKLHIPQKLTNAERSEEWVQTECWHINFISTFSSLPKRTALCSLPWVRLDTWPRAGPWNVGGCDTSHL